MAHSLSSIQSVLLSTPACPDAAYAEAVGAVKAVLMAAHHYTAYRPTRIIIKGDNRPVIDFMNHFGKFRRADLQQLLEDAQHALAFSLPVVYWSYTPREFNTCADYLAGLARDYAKASLEHSSPALDNLSAFSAPLPPSLSSKFSTGSQLLPALSVHYQPSAPDGRGRLYPSSLGAQKLPKHFRTLLFGRTHTELDLVGSHYQLFQRYAEQLLSSTLPSVDTLRGLLTEDMKAFFSASFLTNYIPLQLRIFLPFSSTPPWTILYNISEL